MPTTLCVALRLLFPFQQTQYAQVFPLKPAAFCKLFAGLFSTNKSATSLLLSDSHSFLSSILFSPQSFWQKLFSLSFFTIRLQWVPGHSFLPGNNAADELARQGALLAPSAITCGLSSLISRIHFSLFSDWKRTVSSKFFDTQVISISTEELVLSRCVLSRLRCNGHSLLLNLISLGLEESKILFCSACEHPSQDTSQLILHHPTTFCGRQLHVLWNHC